MAEALGSARPRASLLALLRQVPLGILLIASMLGFMGTGLMIGGLYLMLETGSLTPWAGALVLLCGPAIVYLSYHLVRLAHWAWSALVVLLVLLFLSSIIRIALSGGGAVSPLAEVAIELGILAYLSGPRIRLVFAGRSVSSSSERRWSRRRSARSP